MTDPFESRSFDGPGKLLARVAGSQPRLAYSLAAWVGAIRNRITRRWPTTTEVRRLFPQLGAFAAMRVAAGIGAQYERNRVLVRCVRRMGMDPVRPLVGAVESATPIQGPLILVTFHVGAIDAIGPALERLGTPVLSFRDGAFFTPLPSLQIESTQGTDQDRAAALLRARLHLRDGGIVMLALDIDAPSSIETRCLGHVLRLAPGAFVLSRWTGAPIVPMVTRWTSNGIAVRIGDAIATPQDAADWLERYLLESPSETSLALLRHLLGVS